MSGDPAALKQAVNKLMTNAQSLFDLFLQYHGNEANRSTLKSAYENEGISIKNNLYTLISRTQLKPALTTPNSAYNQFIGVWNNGTGVLSTSFYRLTDFWRSLEAARPELDRLMTPQPGPGNQPTPGHHGTPAEAGVFTRLRSETAELYKVFEEYLHKQPVSTTTIKDHVRVIGELLSNSSLGHDAQMLLASSKSEWANFISKYKNGTGIDWPCFQQLARFQTDADLACFKFLRA